MWLKQRELDRREARFLGHDRLSQLSLLPVVDVYRAVHSAADEEWDRLILAEGDALNGIVMLADHASLFTRVDVRVADDAAQIARDEHWLLWVNLKDVNWVLVEASLFAALDHPEALLFDWRPDAYRKIGTRADDLLAAGSELGTQHLFLVAAQRSKEVPSGSVHYP